MVIQGWIIYRYNTKVDKEQLKRYKSRLSRIDIVRYDFQYFVLEQN